MIPMRERAEKITKEHVSALELDAPRRLQMKAAITAELTAVWNEAVEKCAKVALIRAVSGCPCEGCAARQGIADAQRALKLPEAAASDEEMVEMVAEAIEKAHLAGDGWNVDWEAMARAALAAMRR